VLTYRRILEHKQFKEESEKSDADDEKENLICTIEEDPN